MQYEKKRIAAKIALLTGAAEHDISLLMEYPPNSEMGDLSLPCFKLSRVLRKSPGEIAGEFVGQINDPAIERMESVAGYLNIFLKKQVFAETVLSRIQSEGERYGAQDLGKGKTVVIDYSAPNIAKPFHVGHLRSTVIGHALVQIYSFLGYSCVGINHLGDWGTQFGKLIVAYQLWGSAERVEEGGIDELLRLYVKFHEEAEKDSALEDQARAWFVKMERGDQEALELWRRFVDISMKEFHNIYRLLGVSFDSYAGESFYNDKMEPVIQELKAKKLLTEDDGAWLVRLDDYNMAPALMLKKDGSSLYHTRDVAAAIYRKETYGFDKAIYVTDYAQNLHFQQWFKVIELMGCEWSKELVHVAFGRVRLEGGGLSTRKGNVVKLEDLLLQSINKIKDIISEKNPGLRDKEEIARQIGVGAVIFNDLSSNRMKDIDFSWEEALSFEGETGPYVQYTHARACSVLRKAAGQSEVQPQLNDNAGFDAGRLLNPEALAVLKELSLFPERVEQSMQKLEPSMISRYVVDLAQAFNRFYHECPILVDDLPLRQARLALVKSVQVTLKNGLRLIGILAPEEI